MSFNILIVDDSKAIRSVMRKIVTISGYQINQCWEAGDGKEAIDILSQHRVDFIITDVNMPYLTGMALLDLVKKNETLKDIPVIMVTAAGSSQQREEALQRGASGFIQKPFLPEEIRQILHEVIGVDANGKYKEDQRTAAECDF